MCNVCNSNITTRSSSCGCNSCGCNNGSSWGDFWNSFWFGTSQSVCRDCNGDIVTTGNGNGNGSGCGCGCGCHSCCNGCGWNSYGCND